VLALLGTSGIAALAATALSLYGLRSR